MNKKILVIGADLKPVSEERRLVVLMNMGRKLDRIGEAMKKRNCPESDIKEVLRLKAEVTEELLILVPKIPEYKL